MPDLWTRPSPLHWSSPKRRRPEGNGEFPRRPTKLPLYLTVGPILARSARRHRPLRARNYAAPPCSFPSRHHDNDRVLDGLNCQGWKRRPVQAFIQCQEPVPASLGVRPNQEVRQNASSPGVALLTSSLRVRLESPPR